MKITDLVRGEVYESAIHGPVKYVGTVGSKGEESAMFKILNRKTNGLRYWRIDLLDIHLKPKDTPDDCSDCTALSAAYARDAELAAQRLEHMELKARYIGTALKWTINTLAGGFALAAFALFFFALWLRSV